MALCSETQSFEVVTWSGACTPQDTITVTLQSGTRVVFRGMRDRPGSPIKSPSFRLDPVASDQAAVWHLYEDAVNKFYHNQSRWWRFRHFAMRDLKWAIGHVEFGLQLDSYDSDIHHKRTLAVGRELVVFFILDGKQVGWYSSRLPMYTQVVGDMSDALMQLNQDPVRTSSIIVSIK